MNSRRKFLGGLCMAAVAPAFANAQIGASDVKWDEEWDVLVVGSGFGCDVSGIR